MRNNKRRNNNWELTVTFRMTLGSAVSPTGTKNSKEKKKKKKENVTKMSTAEIPLSSFCVGNLLLGMRLAFTTGWLIHPVRLHWRHSFSFAR